MKDHVCDFARTPELKDELWRNHAASCVECSEMLKVSEWMTTFAALTPPPADLPRPGYFLVKSRIQERHAAAERATLPIYAMGAGAGLLFGGAMVGILASDTRAATALFGGFDLLLSFAAPILFASVIVATIYARDIVRNENDEVVRAANKFLTAVNPVRSTSVIFVQMEIRSGSPEDANQMKTLCIALLITLLFNSVCTFGQQGIARNPGQFTDSFDSYIRKTLEKIPDVPAVAVVVIKDDKPIFLRASGFADKERGIKADENTLFYIASSTKAFTALAASMLDKEGKIKFGDPAVKYASGIQFKTPIPDKITIRDLLTHTSGLRNDALVHRTAFTGQIEPGELSLVLAQGTTIDEALLGKYRYTNLGYNVYGMLLENSLKKKWQDLLQERIFDPMAMKHTTAYPSRAASKKWTLAAPYVFDSQSAKTIRSVLEKKDNNMQAAGGLFASISDIGRWLNMNMNDGRLNGKQVIPAELVRAAHTGYTQTKREDPPFTGEGEYGLGWQIGKYRNEKVIYHHGGFTGYSSHFSYLPDKRIAVAVVTNSDAVGGRTGHLLATYAYDWWLETADLEGEYDKQLLALVDAYERRKTGSHGSALERSKRTWQLSKPFADYAGKYRHDMLGTIEIVPQEKALAVNMGYLSTVATPFTEKDTIRVEMLPGGNGEVIGFKEADGKVVSLTYGGVTFTRVP